MDPKHSGDVFKHLEKQNELLMDACRSMSHEWRRLQVEEEMLMRKYYEFMAAQNLVEKRTSAAVREDEETSGAGALVVASSEEQVNNKDGDWKLHENEERWGA